MKYRWQSKKRQSKLSTGQISLYGDIYNFQLKYPPHLSVYFETGEAVVVLRLPNNASQMDCIASRTEAERMANEYRPHFKKEFWINKARDKRREQGLMEVSVDYSTT